MVQSQNRVSDPPLVGQAQTGGSGHQSNHGVMNRWRKIHSGRLPNLQQKERWFDQE